MSTLENVLNPEAGNLERTYSNSESFVSSKAAKRMGFIVNRKAGGHTSQVSTSDNELRQRYGHSHSHTEVNIAHQEIDSFLFGQPLLKDLARVPPPSLLPQAHMRQVSLTLLPVQHRRQPSLNLLPRHLPQSLVAHLRQKLSSGATGYHKQSSSLSSPFHRAKINDGTSFDILLKKGQATPRSQQGSPEKTKQNLLQPSPLITTEEEQDLHQIDRSSAYFRRLSILPEMPRDEKQSEKILGISRKLLFVFSEFYSALKRFNVVNTGHSKTRDKIVVSLLLSKKKINKLVEVLEAAEAAETQLDGLLANNIVSVVNNNVIVFKQVSIFLMKNLQNAVSKADACFIRVLLLSFYGCCTELYNAWEMLDGLKLAIQQQVTVQQSSPQALISDKQLYDTCSSAIKIALTVCAALLDILSSSTTSPLGQKAIEVDQLKFTCNSMVEIVKKVNQRLPVLVNPEALNRQRLKTTLMEDIGYFCKSIISIFGLSKILMPDLRDIALLRADMSSLSKISKQLVTITGQGL